MGNRLTSIKVLLFVIHFCMYESKFTTAVIKENTSPKPTYSTFDLDTEVDTNSGQQAFHNLSGRRKNSKMRSKIWDWDTWCLLQPREGKCDQSIDRFYYDRQLEKCLPFVYSGCNANENNFVTKSDCEVRCAGVTATMSSRIVNQTLLCQYQPDVGACLAFETKYYFDVNRNTCSKFVYGGCAGNTNRFDTKFHCMQTCGHQNQ